MKKILAASIFVLTFCLFAFGQKSNCPEINVNGPASYPQPEEEFSYTVTLDEKAEKLELEYVWSVDKGEIIKGQGTRQIIVKYHNFDSTTIATVEIKGLPKNCPSSFSDSTLAIYDPIPQAKLIDELLTSDSQIDSAKFDKITTALKDNQWSTVFIIIYADEKTPPKRLEQKQIQIRKYIKDKNVPPDRIVIVIGGEGKDLIRLWLVPAGAKPPTP